MLRVLLRCSQTTQTSSADSAGGGCPCYIVFLWACVLLDLGKSHGDEAYNASWRRHKPFICIHQIRGSHFIRRAVACSSLSPLCPLQIRCPLCRLQPDNYANYSGQRCWQTHQEDCRRWLVVVFRVPCCDPLCNLTSMEQKCNGFFWRNSPSSVSFVRQNSRASTEDSLLWVTVSHHKN